MIVKVKAGVQFTRIAPGGFRLLSAIESTARHLELDLTITCACEAHPPNDPHTRGVAFDLRSHDWDAATKDLVVNALRLELGAAFFVFLEDPDGQNEHVHAQVRRGVAYP